MKYKSPILAVLLAAFAGSALAQNHISGTLKCGDGKSDAELTVQVGDHDGHILLIDKGGSPCTWSVPIEIAGLKSTTQSGGAGVTEVDGVKFEDRGYGGVMTMENGDKIYSNNQDTGVVTEGGKAVTYEGTWSFTGGTGRFKGITGKGTYKGSGAPGGANESQLEGEYSLPGAGATAK